MKALSRHYSHPRFRVFSALLVLVSLACTRIPLLNYLGFEFSAIMAVTASYFAGLLTISYAGQAGESHGVARLFLESSMGGLLLLVGPLLIISLNALVVRNCSFPDGIAFYLLGPVPSVLFVVSLAVLLVSRIARWRKTTLTLLFVLVLAQVPFVTLTSSRIFAFNPILGYFPGITYDESLQVFDRLAVFRSITLLATAVLVLAAALFRSSQGTNRHGRSRLTSAGFAAGVFALLALYIFSDRVGLSSSDSSIRSELGGEYSTEHFMIFYPEQSVAPRDIEEIALKHEFILAEIARELRIVPGKRIRSFLYASPGQKGRLIGAAGTSIAKPWLWELHMNVSDVHRILKHEMVHVVAADFGLPILRISTNSGLIEGLATAVERVEYDETVHRLASQIVSAGIHPDVESLFSLTGFFTSYGGASYVLAGSFCRYLIDQYGLRRFKWVYRTGSFRTFYNKDLSVLLDEWRRFLAHPEPTTGEREKAAYLFRRPSIFGKECARVISSVNEQTRQSLRERRFADAVESSRRSLSLSRTPEAILQHVTALLRAGQAREARSVGLDALRDSAVHLSLLPIHLVLGDAAWMLGETKEARERYGLLLSRHLSSSYDETCAIRLSALRSPLAPDLRPIVLGEVSDSVRIALLTSISSASGIRNYLLAREFMNADSLSEAGKLLERAAVDEGLEFFRLKRLGSVHTALREYQKAKIAYWESLNYTTKEAHRIGTAEFIRWCDWMDEHFPGGSPP